MASGNSLRPGHTGAVNAAVRVLMALAALGSTACNLDLPPGCADILVARSDEAQCLSGARCEQVYDDLTYVARWHLMLADTEPSGSGEVIYTVDELDERRRCVAEYLDNRGVVLVDRGESGSRVIVAEGIEKNFRAVLDFEPIESFELSCSGEVCEYCYELELIDCDRDAFCSTLDAQPWNEAQACVDAFTVVSCTSPEDACDSAVTWAQDPDGTCWQFPSSCVPVGWSLEVPECDALGFSGPYCG